jgi:hypothetical protein
MTKGEIALKQIWLTATYRQVEDEEDREKGGGEWSNSNALHIKFLGIYSNSVKHLSLNKIYGEAQILR